MNSSKALLVSAALALAAIAPPAAAQQFPSKPIRVIAAYPSGSGPDTVLRIVGERLTRAWSQQI